jgi:hypothetical protein
VSVVGSSEGSVVDGAKVGDSDGLTVGACVSGVVVGSSVVGTVLGYAVVGLRVPTIGESDGCADGAREGAGIPSQQIICCGRSSGPPAPL